LGNQLHVINEAIYPIIVAASVVTTFLTPYIMKASVPCYNFLYKHAPERLRNKIDLREQEVARAEQKTSTTTAETNAPAKANAARRVVNHTIVTKRLVDLFIENISANDKPHAEYEE